MGLSSFVMWGNFTFYDKTFKQPSSIVIDYNTKEAQSVIKAGRNHCSYYSTNTVYSYTATGWYSLSLPFTMKELFACYNYNVLRSDQNELYIQIVLHHWNVEPGTVRLLGNFTFDTISCGKNAIFFAKDGKGFAIGRNQFGEFGNGNLNDTFISTPQFISLPEHIKEINYVDQIIAALSESGNVYIWGTQNIIFPGTLTPQKLTITKKITSFSVGICHLILMDEDQNIWSVGCNDNYACASTELMLREPRLLRFDYDIPSSIVMMSRSLYFFNFVSNEGKLYARGANDWNQIGFSGSNYITTATEVPFFYDKYVIKVVSGFDTTVVITQTGDLYLMGTNLQFKYKSQITNQNTLVEELESSVMDVCIGDRFVAIVSSNNSLFILGEFNNFQHAVPTLYFSNVSALSCISSSRTIAFSSANKLFIMEQRLSYQVESVDYFAVSKNMVIYSNKNELFTIFMNKICKLRQFQRSIIQIVASDFVVSVLLDSGEVFITTLVSTGCEQLMFRNFSLPIFNQREWDVIMSSYDNINFGRRISIAQVPICFEKRMFDYTTSKNLCGGIKQGRCVGFNQCLCNEGFFGDDCSKFKCFGIDKENKQICSGHGTCFEPDKCDCIPGYTGDNCSIPKCASIPATNNTVCSGRGICVDRDVCHCDFPTLGAFCEDATTMLPLIITIPLAIFFGILFVLVVIAIIAALGRTLYKYKIERALIDELQQHESIEDEKYSKLRQEIENAAGVKWISNLAGNGIHGFQLGDRIFVAKVAKDDEYTHGMKFRHQNLLPWLAQREFNGVKYVINERMTGTLEQYLNDSSRRKNLDLHRTNGFKIALESCFGLAVLHFKHKLVHRDIKRINILVNYDIATLRVELVKIFDFDACKRVDDTDWNTCVQKFTLGYDAPEIHSRTIKNPILLDIYSLGIVFQTLFGDDDELCLNMTNSVPEKRPKNVLQVIQHLLQRIKQEKLSKVLQSEVKYANILIMAFDTKDKIAKPMPSSSRQSIELETLNEPLLNNFE